LRFCSEIGNITHEYNTTSLQIADYSAGLLLTRWK